MKVPSGIEQIVSSVVFLPFTLDKMCPWRQNPSRCNKSRKTGGFRQDSDKIVQTVIGQDRIGSKQMTTITKLKTDGGSFLFICRKQKQLQN